MMWNVRLRTRWPTFKGTDGKKHDEWIFITEGGRCTIDNREDCVHARAHAGRMAVESIWGDRQVAALYLSPNRGIEIWPAAPIRASAR